MIDWPALLDAWCGAERDEAVFWSSTPRQVDRVLRAEQTRQLNSRNMHMSVAWHAASIQRRKTFPSHDSMMSKARKAVARPRRQSWQEQFAVMGQWAAVQNRIEAQKGKR